MAVNPTHIGDILWDGWLLTLSAGLVWGLYAILQHDLTIIAASFFQSVTSGIIIALKIFKASVSITPQQEFAAD